MESLIKIAKFVNIQLRPRQTTVSETKDHRQPKLQNNANLLKIWTFEFLLWFSIEFFETLSVASCCPCLNKFILPPCPSLWGIVLSCL